MSPQETTYGDSGPSWIKRIVVAADGSVASTRGLEQVADLAPRIGASVVAVYVRHLPATALMGSSVADTSWIETLDEQESEVRHEVMRLLGGTGVAWEFVVRVGSPGEEIVRVVDESDADLVVVGSNHHSSLHNLLLGSTAAYLATHSLAPVLVMRSRDRAAGGTLPASVEATR
jgi:nucleotide-binding universal stress UspA family protein